MSLAAPADRPFSHLGLGLAALAAAVGGTMLGPLVGGLALAAATALPVAGLCWLVLYFGYVSQRRPNLAVPYLLILWLAAAAATSGYGVWRDWLAKDAKVPATRTGDRAAPAAIATRPTPQVAPAAPDAVSRLIDGYYAAMKSGAETYVREVGETGALSAISGPSLSAPGGVAAAPDRIRAGREVTIKGRDAALARTDQLIAAVKALHTDTEARRFLVEDMLAELETVRERRADYWATLLEVSDEMEALARHLARTQDDWRVDLDARQVVFETAADDAAYKLHADRYAELSGQIDRLQAGLNRSADSLKGMAGRWAP